MPRRLGWLVLLCGVALGGFRGRAQVVSTRATGAPMERAQAAPQPPLDTPDARLLLTDEIWCDPDSAPWPPSPDDIVGGPNHHHTLRNIKLLIGAGFVGAGLLWSLPSNASKWRKGDHGLRHWLGAYTSAPTWDHDPFMWNWVAHPVFGAMTYSMERSYDESPIRAFVFSALASVGWEYGFEAPMEHPSNQDLIITPVLGSLLGEAIHQLTLRMRRGGFTPLEAFVITLINPVYVVQRGYHE